MVGLDGVRETLVRLAPPPVPSSPFLPPQPQRAIIAHIIVEKTKMDRSERLTIQSTCKRVESPAFKLTSLCFNLGVSISLFLTRQPARASTFLNRNLRPAAFLSWLREPLYPAP